jgi:photosystem II stability/assembly factor-like uncharacterized protein
MKASWIGLAIGITFLAAPPGRAGSNQWTVLFPRTSGSVSSLAVDPINTDILYIATTVPPDLWRSQDRGLSWNSLRTGTLLESAGTLRQVAVDPRNPSHLLVISSSPSGFYQSFDGGATWSGRRFDAGLLNGGYTTAFGLSSDARTIYVAAHETCDSLYGVFLGCSGGGVLESSDGGATWSRTRLDDRTIGRVLVDPLDARIAYAISEDDIEPKLLAILRTADGGLTWTQLGPQAAPRLLVIDPMAPANLYLCSNSGFWTSRDRGDSWQIAGTNSLLDVLAFALDPIDPAGLFVSGPSLAAGPIDPLNPAPPAFVILRSADRGQTWNRFIDAPAVPVSELIIDSRRSSFYEIRGGDVVGYTLAGARRHTVRH